MRPRNTNRNVFVLSTGRCGSVTFYRACQHITNYSVGHEDRSRLIGKDRLAYPGSHIEIDNRLSWFLGRLQRRYGDKAFYVHLRRDPEAVAQSYLKRFGWGIMAAYWNGIVQYGTAVDRPLDVCRDYVETVESNIEFFLRDKSHAMTVELETARDDFERFWRWIGAEGDLGAALQTWESVHNASETGRREILDAEFRRQIFELKRLSRSAVRTFRRVLTA